VAHVQNTRTGWLQGLLYGLIPHTLCIAFIVLSIAGATAATSVLARLFYLPHFIEIIIGLAFLFATLSAAIYLARNGLLSRAGIRFKRSYLLTMYATTIAINLLFFWVVFPTLARVSLPTASAQAVPVAPVAVPAGQQLASVTLEVAIPCSGHAFLVISELDKVDGVMGTVFADPNLFQVDYDASQVTLDTILAQPVFQSFAATVKG
jgi:hypothetical protein